MCSTVLWTINRSAYTPGFRAWTLECLGTEPQPSALQIQDPLVAGSAMAFTVTLDQCDCRCAIGLGEDRLPAGAPPAGTYVDWLHGISARSTFVKRVCVVRAWNPENSVTPADSFRLDAGDLVPERLGMLPEETLLAIDFPAPGF